MLNDIDIPDVNREPLNSNPFLGIGLTSLPNLDMEKLENFVDIDEIPENDDRLLSKITLKIWKKMLKHFENRTYTNLQNLEKEYIEDIKEPDIEDSSEDDFSKEDLKKDFRFLKFFFV